MAGIARNNLHFSDCGVKGTAVPLQRNLKIKS